jgi:ParB family transcriptional regulator, chromosome partitioning protein
VNWLNLTKPTVVDPHAVDLEDKTYLVPCYCDLSALVKSIEKVGLLNSPLVQELADGRLVPVAGRRRLQAAVALGLEEVTVRVLPDAIPVAEGFTLAFWDNVPHRTFDPACMAVVVRRLLELFPREVAALEFLPVLGIPLKGPRLERLRAIGGLEHLVLDALSQGRIHEKTAAILCEVEPETRLRLLELMGNLRLNANKTADIISWLFDLSVLEGKPIAESLASGDARNILSDGDSPVQERAERFRELVRRWKFPELTAREAEFREWASHLPPSGRVSVKPTSAFEDPACVLEIRAASKNEAQRILSSLKQSMEP